MPESAVPTTAFDLRFHHNALASKYPELALAFIANLGYAIGERTYDALQNVNLVLCTHDRMPVLELVFRAEGPGPLDVLLHAAGEGLYHTCYETTDLAALLASLKAAGHRVVCVSSPKPAVLFGGRLVSFYKIKGLGLVELLEP